MDARSPSQRRGRQIGQGTLGVATDPDGRLVRLTARRWRHIVSGHPELGRHRDDLLRAVRRPTLKIQGRAPQEEWFYLADAGPSRWLKVVVLFQGAEGWVVTAFARRAAP